MRITTVCLLVVGLVLSGCSSKKDVKSAKLDPFAGQGSPYYKGKGAIPVGGGTYHVGTPYQVAGRWFTPKEQPNYDKTGMSSWYGEAFHRRRTSNGEYFDMNQLTAAHATLPLPSYVRVTNLANGKSAVVRVNDRGPFVDTRILDVSKRTAEVLDYKHKGTQKVRVQYLGPAPINDPAGRDLLAMNDGTAVSQSPVQVAAAKPHKKSPPRSNDDVSEDMQVAEAPIESSPLKGSSQFQTARYDQQGARSTRQTNGLRRSYYIDLGTYADPDNVERIRQGLTDVGQMQVAEVDGNQGTLYKLRMGPIEDVNDATAVMNEAVNFGVADAKLIEVPMQQAFLVPPKR